MTKTERIRSLKKEQDAKPAAESANDVVNERAAVLSALPALPKPKKQEPRPKREQHEYRLPNGSRFEFVYDAAAKTWSGRMIVGAQVFEGTWSGVRRLWDKLDAQYRATLTPTHDAAAPIS